MSSIFNWFSSAKPAAPAKVETASNGKVATAATTAAPSIVIANANSANTARQNANARLARAGQQGIVGAQVAKNAAMVGQTSRASSPVPLKEVEVRNPGANEQVGGRKTRKRKSKAKAKKRKSKKSKKRKSKKSKKRKSKKSKRKQN